MKKIMKTILIISTMILFVFATNAEVNTSMKAVRDSSPPTTVVINSDADDGYLIYNDINYSTTHDSATGTVFDDGGALSIGQFKFYTYKTISRSALFFDTSCIPDNATISSVKLTLILLGDVSTTDFNIVIQNGQPMYPSKPLMSTDYNYLYYSGNGGSFNTDNLPDLDKSFNITLNANGKSWVNKNGTTKFMLRSSRDVAVIEPMGDEYVTLYGFEFGEPYIPKLTITYRNKMQPDPIDLIWNDNLTRDWN